MRLHVLRASLLVAACAATPCGADIVADAYDLAVRTTRPAGPAAPYQLTIVSLAMFDAANAVERRYQPYLPQPAPPADASADAAALGAACAALSALQPAQQAEVAKACDAIASTIPAGVAAGRRFGESTGNAMVAARRGDGLGTPNAYRPFTTAGAYVPTALPIGFDVATMKPFALTSPSQLRPGPPPALSSETWARDFNEVKAMGARAGSARTPQQTETAQFFASAGPQQFLDSIRDQPIAVDGAAARARYFALAHMAIWDAGIAHFDAKYAYGFWRPLTAIRNGDLDGNDATARDPGWLPLVETPLHPEYPCAHCNVGTAFAVVIASYLTEGERARPLTIRAAAGIGAFPPRQYLRAADLSAEIVDSRVWGGIHFRTSGETGAELGRRLGEYMLGTQLRPLAAAR